MKKIIIQFLICLTLILMPINQIKTNNIFITTTYAETFDDDTEYEEEDNESSGWFQFPDIGKMIEDWIKSKIQETSEFAFGSGIKIDGMFLKNVIYPEKNIKILEKFYSAFSKYIKSIAMSVIILYALWYGFKIYILWKDGNPEENPKELIVRFICAISIILCYDEVVNIASALISEIINNIMRIGGEIEGSSFLSSLGRNLSILSIIGVIFTIIYFFQYWKMMFGTIKMGVELFILRLGVPLACINIVHPQSNTWNAYILTFIKNYIGICLNVLLMRIGTRIYDENAGGFFGLLWACVFLSLANGSKDLLNQFIMSSSNGMNGQQMLNMGGTAIGYGKKAIGTIARKGAQGVATGGTGAVAP